MFPYNFFAFIRSEFDTTDTDDIAIANPANTGFKSQPKIGKKTPAARGMPMML